MIVAQRLKIVGYRVCWESNKEPLNCGKGHMKKRWEAEEEAFKGNDRNDGKHYWVDPIYKRVAE